MKIKFLGTAAAEGVPGIFCECENCRKARELGGKEIRTRSQAIINDELLIDFPADTYMHHIMYGVNIPSVKNLIITHSHEDHLYPSEFLMRLPGFAPTATEKMNVYAGKASIEEIKKAVPEYENALNLYEVSAFTAFEAGGYSITPLPSVHSASTTPFFYIIEKDGKKILYAHDTDFFRDDVWEFFKKEKPYFSLVSLDCTNANVHYDYVGHMGLEKNAEIRRIFLENGYADEKTIFVCNHFSHNPKGMNYCDFAPVAAKLGFVTSYDGLEEEV